MRNKNARVPDPNSFVSNPGDRFHIEYSAEVQKDGTINLVECGKTDIQEYIQSFKDKTDMAYILKMLALGDTSVLSAKIPFYGDFTECPSTMIEWQQRLLDGKRAFESLPLDVRNTYDHDLNKFLADLGSDHWREVMKDFLPQQDKPVESSEVIADA